MRGPVLTINGGADMTPLTDRGPGWHDDPYKLGPVGRDMCLMVVAGAGHYLGGIDSPLRAPPGDATPERSEEHTSELQSLMRISYAVFCLKKKLIMKYRTDDK